MKRFVLICWIAAGSVTALVLFQIKQEVRTLEQEIAGAQREILRDQEAVHVLEAEWSYLNSPARLSALAERHLEMSALPVERVIGFDDLPLPGEPEADDTPQSREPDGQEPAGQKPARPTLVAVPAAAGVSRQ